jgi:hypothetical protein
MHIQSRYSSNSNDCISLYYKFIIKLLDEIKLEKDIYINYNDNNNETQGLFTIYVNLEHTLVKQGGRGVLSDTEKSEIKYNDINYLIRLCNLESYKHANIIFDYSIPNIINTKHSIHNIYNKSIYLPPLLFPYNPISEKRQNNVITTFMNINEPRRKALLFNLIYNSINIINVSNCFTESDTITLFKNTKILINIHQTEHHDTFEELRCLPALLCGCIVISEESPLKEYIPYNKHIIWATYENIPNVVHDVINNYTKYWSSIFSNSDIENTLNNMKTLCINTLKKKLNEV